ncbi:MAG: hypothetical protein BWK73_02750 [Thiothrix lacustris]|uniref:Glycosyltransferase 2-like domain-containing protein n=2 Tax=Pseudomonadota TaxID=1224 RepID=A0A1Y1QYS5_9GAMM|nr:MAG: hypothetical protein BWK73_02750 [Thiothrix lacustris]
MDSRNNITVIMPTFNGQRYIGEQIESIISALSQGDELICLDDASTDDTVHILTKLARDFKQLTVYVNEVNLGPNMTVWKLLQLVQTELFVFCDQDDIWLPGRLDITRKCSINELSVVAYQPFVLNGAFLTPVRPKKLNWLRTIVKPTVPGCTIGGSVKIVRKLFPLGNISSIYDQFILMNALLKKVKINVDNEVRILYRRHDNTVTKMGFAPDGITCALVRKFVLIKDISHALL